MFFFMSTKESNCQITYGTNVEKAFFFLIFWVYVLHLFVFCFTPQKKNRIDDSAKNVFCVTRTSIEMPIKWKFFWKLLSTQQYEFLNSAYSYLYLLCSNPYGCCDLRKCIEFLSCVWKKNEPKWIQFAQFSSRLSINQQIHTSAWI